MKLSEMQKYRELVSAHHRSEISNEEMQKAFIADGAILSNLYQEIEMDSDSVDCHDDVNYTKDSVQLHSHTFYEMLYCCSGNVQYLLGAERYRVHRGDIIFIPPGISHRPLYLDQLAEPYSRYVIWIHPEFMKNIQQFLGFTPLSDPVLLRTQDSGWEYLERYFQSACKEAEIRQEGFEACMSSITVQLLIHLTRACTHSKAMEPLTEKKELLDELIRYIEDHLAEKITLKSAAANFYISERAVVQRKNGRQLLSVRNPAPADCSQNQNYQWGILRNHRRTGGVFRLLYLLQSVQTGIFHIAPAV